MGASSHRYDLIVAGGGAAGFFGAINAAKLNASLKILILEKTTKLLSKVKVSGGGRCNVTHHCFEPTPLSQHYPRGQRELKKLFRAFQATDTQHWFADAGVELITEDDGRMFPVTEDSQTIIDCFLRLASQYKIDILTSSGITMVNPGPDGFAVSVNQQQNYHCSKLLITIGGHPQNDAYVWIQKLGHNIVPVIPSLFTFNDSEKNFKDLMGVSVPHAEVRIAGSKFIQRGPVLITHWGLSGPAVITLSSWAAEHLHAMAYTFTALVNWTGQSGEEEIRKELLALRDTAHRKIKSHPLFAIPQRLWDRLIELAEITADKIWSEASNKDINRLIEFIYRCPFQIRGKTTFKEEFVSCGGVDLNDVALATMESKIVPGIYFAGEVLNIDGETGGFNFQAAWTTAYVAAKNIALT